MNTTYDLAIESFMEYLDGMEIAEEGLGYKITRKVHTSKLHLKHQLNQQKSDLEKRYRVAVENGKEEMLKEMIQKRKNGILRKINGKEISKFEKKEILKDFIRLYDSYLNKL